MFASPVMMLSSALINLDPQDFDNPDATVLDRLIKKAPAMLTPVVSGIIHGLGLTTERMPDPTTTSHLRRPIMALVNYGRSQGWFGEEKANSLAPDFVDKMITGMYTGAYDLANKITFGGLDAAPGTQRPEIPDPNANDNQMVQSRIRDLVYEDYEVPLSITLEDLYNQYPEAFDALYTALTAWQTGAQNDYANKAFGDYAGGRLATSGASLVIPGGARLRSESNDLLTQARDLAAINPGNPAADASADAASESLSLSRLGGVPATQVEFGGAAVSGAGTDRGELLVDQWNEIAFGKNPGSIIGGFYETNVQMQTMTDEERRQVANLWASQLPPADQQLLMQTRDAREAESQNYPEDVKYRAWSRGARDMGVEAFRQDMMKNNPNYARYINGLSPEIKSDKELFDAMSTSHDAYLASIGEPAQVFDPAPLSTNTGGAYYPSAASSGGASQAYTKKDPLTSLQDAYTKYRTDVALYQNALVAFTGNPSASLEGMNPMLRSAVKWHLDQAGISAPSKPQQVAQYETWATMQQGLGQPNDMASYIAWRESLRSVLEPQGLDVDVVIQGVMDGRVDIFAGTVLGDAIQQAVENPDVYAGTTLGETQTTVRP
jgi:hypothetical protein